MITRPTLSPDNQRQLLSAALVAGLVLAVGLIAAPDRVWSNLLLGAFYLLTIGLGGTLFLALTYVTGAGWHVAFRRVPESMAKIIPLTGVGLLLVLVLRMREYGWHHHGDHGAGTFWFKELWLTPGFWILRAIGYVAVWSLLSFWLVARSRKQDAQDVPQSRATAAGSIRISALFLAVYAITFSLASADWLMALDPLWFSTMWGVYNLSGMMLSGLATVVILCIVLSHSGGPLSGVFTQDHLHDLGKLVVGFSCFWMYIWFSQYMLIWYSNIPEETSYFIARTRSAWAPVVVISIVLNWIVPFFALLPQPAKRSRTVMLRIAIVLLIGRWVDLYLMVFPSTLGESPVFGIWEIAAVCTLVATGILVLIRSFPTEAPVPTHDPYLQESLHYHAG